LPASLFAAHELEGLRLAFAPEIFEGTPEISFLRVSWEVALLPVDNTLSGET
jgi:hypothetical protein